MFFLSILTLWVGRTSATADGFGLVTQFFSLSFFFSLFVALLFALDFFDFRFEPLALAGIPVFLQPLPRLFILCDSNHTKHYASTGGCECLLDLVPLRRRRTRTLFWYSSPAELNQNQRLIEERVLVEN